MQVPTTVSCQSNWPQSCYSGWLQRNKSLNGRYVSFVQTSLCSHQIYIVTNSIAWCFNFSFCGLLKLLSCLARCGYSSYDNRRLTAATLWRFCMHIVLHSGTVSSLQFKGWTHCTNVFYQRDIAKLRVSFFFSISDKCFLSWHYDLYFCFLYKILRLGKGL